LAAATIFKSIEIATAQRRPVFHKLCANETRDDPKRVLGLAAPVKGGNAIPKNDASDIKWTPRNSVGENQPP